MRKGANLKRFQVHQQTLHHRVVQKIAENRQRMQTNL